MTIEELAATLVQMYNNAEQDREKRLCFTCLEYVTLMKSETHKQLLWKKQIVLMNE